jgi:hypothetical protein
MCISNVRRKSKHFIYPIGAGKQMADLLEKGAVILKVNCDWLRQVF